VLPAHGCRTAVAARADKEKEKGNECFKSGEYDTAIAYYTRGLELNPRSAIIFANRAMAYLRQERPADAVKDCDVRHTSDPSCLLISRESAPISSSWLLCRCPRCLG
jgi:tetratricopeptide (TPR) repeat protein